MVTSGHVVLGLICPLWSFILPLNMAAWVEFKDQPQVIGSHQPITAALGDDVILPCHLEPKFNVQGLTVEWSKPDLKPDPSDPLSRVEYVHLYRNREEVPDMKMESYLRRTQLFRDGLKDGNISLKIMNVTLADEGRYRCFIPKLKSRWNEAVIRLIVEPNTVEMETTELLHPGTMDPDDERGVKVTVYRTRVMVLISGLLVLLILAGGVGYFLKQKPNCPKYDVSLTKPPTLVGC